MGNQMITSMVTVATAIIGVAIIATLVSNKAQTGSVIQAATGGFAQDLSTALSPVTGGSGGSSLSPTSFTGGGASYLL